MAVYVSGVRRGRTDDGYPVQDAETSGSLGRVVPVLVPSHTRRGRTKAQPWWQARDLEGNAVGIPQQTRRAAAALLDPDAKDRT